MAKRKHETVKREVVAKIRETQQILQAAKDATSALVDGGEALAPDAMKGACEKAGTTQQTAREAISETRQLLISKQKEARSNNSGDGSSLAELTKMMEEIDRIQAELDTQNGLLRDQEHKFVAQRLVKDATDMVESLERKVATTTETAGPLVSEQKEDFTAEVFLTQIIAALRQHMSSKSKKSEDLFSEMTGNSDV